MSVLGVSRFPKVRLSSARIVRGNGDFGNLNSLQPRRFGGLPLQLDGVNYFTVASLASAPEVSLRHVHNFVAVAVDHGLDHVPVEPRCLREADGGRKGEFLTSDCYVAKCRAGVCKRLVERRLDLLRGVDSPASNPGNRAGTLRAPLAANNLGR